MYLGIDTSNYTTSVAILGNGIEINSKKLLPVKEGEIGLRQSDAVFHHVRQLNEVFENAVAKLPQGVLLKDLTAIGVSVSPRSVEGSYMPCFLVGKMLAETLSDTLGVPCYHFSHQQGHIAAALYSANKLEFLSSPFLAYHLSGGTSEGLLVKPDEKGLPDAQLVCTSLDLKAGQSIDRIGVKLGFPFPAGRYLDAAAKNVDFKEKMKPSVNGANFNLSGLQNKCENLISQGKSKEYVSRYCLEYIIATIEMSVKALKKEYGNLPLVFSGGVSSNSLLKERMRTKFDAVFAEPTFSADNAFGVAVLAMLENKINNE